MNRPAPTGPTGPTGLPDGAGELLTSATPATLGARWRALSPVTRLLTVVVGVAVVLNAALVALREITGGAGPGGPASSSFATGEDGLAALADLLVELDRPLLRLTEPLDRAELSPEQDTLVVAQPEVLTPAEARAAARFVTAGGRLVSAGDGVALGLAAEAGDDAPSRPERGLRWAPRRAPGRSEEGLAVPVVPAAETAGVGAVAPSGLGAWTELGPWTPLLAAGAPGGEAVLAAALDDGAGRLVAIADAGIWQNRLLAAADNAAFALAALGEPGRRVVFAEASHGYGRASGLKAIPAAWRWAAALGLAATLTWFWARGRRLGPPDRPHRALAPPRADYADALGRLLARSSGGPGAAAPLAAYARRRAARRAGVAPDSPYAVVAEAAVRTGLVAGPNPAAAGGSPSPSPGGALSAEELALVYRDDGEVDPLELGRIVAKLERRP